MYTQICNKYTQICSQIIKYILSNCTNFISLHTNKFIIIFSSSPLVSRPIRWQLLLDVVLSFAHSWLLQCLTNILKCNIANFYLK